MPSPHRRWTCDGSAPHPDALHVHLRTTGHPPSCLAVHYVVHPVPGGQLVDWWWFCTLRKHRLTPPSTRTLADPDEVRRFIHDRAQFVTAA